jgi:type IV pilus assembly protein PilQ
MTAVSFGCASPKPADVRQYQPKRISDLIISEHSESLVFTIKGDQSLTYTVDKQLAPPGIVLVFPDTTLVIPNRIYAPPNNEIISSIAADEIIAEKKISSRILIALRRDTPYDLIPGDAGLQITFPRAIPYVNEIKPQKKWAGKKPEPKLAAINLPDATRLNSVAATPLQNNIAVIVKANGPIKNYKLFTTDNPARIVIDMYNLKSPHTSEQKMVVESQWVKRIRHFGHPDKVRLVLDIKQESPSKYSAHPTNTGLLIYVGRIPAVSDNTSQKP